MYCIEIRLCTNGLVCIRDGAHTRFSKSSSVDEFTPTQGLKNFLLNYVDESVVHCRRLKWDDETSPTSPIGVEDGTIRAQSPRDANQRNISANSNAPGSPASKPPIPIAVVNPLNSANHSQPPPSDRPFNVSSPVTAPNWPGSPGITRTPSSQPDEKPITTTADSTPMVASTTTSRSWRNAVPTLLTNEALETLCFPGPHPQPEVPGPDMCPLERFLGCVYMRRNLQRFIQSEEHVSQVVSQQCKHN